MSETIYVKMHPKIKVSPSMQLKLKDVCTIVGEEKSVKQLCEIAVYQIEIKDKNIVIIDAMFIIQKIYNFNSSLDIQTIGPQQTIVEVQYPKSKLTSISFVVVWILLFLGSSLAIMNFHEDVSMQEVHNKMYYLITGKEIKQPLILQIPYSIGIGLGMVLFFNHVFKKRINEEPSPLEVEMFKYQQDLNQYMILNNNKEGMRKLDDS